MVERPIKEKYQERTHYTFLNINLISDRDRLIYFLNICYRMKRLFQHINEVGIMATELYFLLTHDYVYSLYSLQNLGFVSSSMKYLQKVLNYDSINIIVFNLRVLR